MKGQLVPWLGILLIILSACVPLTETAAVPTPPPATTRPAAEVVPPTMTQRPTSTAAATPTAPTPSPSATLTAVSCPSHSQIGGFDLPAQLSLLRVLYTINNQYWLWQEEMDSPVSLPIFSENWPLVSPDGQYIAYSRTPNDQVRELWGIDSDGLNERKLATLEITETLGRYPEEGHTNFDVRLTYWWANDQLLIYRLAPALLIGGIAKEALYLVDIDSNTTQMILPPDIYGADVGISPDGNFAVALTADFTELHLITVADSQIQLRLPASSMVWTFSPDGRYLLLPSPEGALIIDLNDFSQQTAPFPYRGIGFPGGAVRPPAYWANDSAWYFVISDNSDGPEFTVWHLNLSERSAVPLGAYTGFAHLATFSPDGRYLAFVQEAGEGNNRLHLVDLSTGKADQYGSELYGLLFDHWLSDSTHFIYNYWDSSALNQRFLLLGAVGEPPNGPDIPLPNTDLQWVDDLRYFQLQELLADDKGQRAILCLQALDKSPLLIAELFALPEGYFYYSHFFEIH